jgi:ribose 5-phosphate isomerase B
MRIAVGADHAGYALKEEIKRALAASGVEVEDVGTHSPESTDYPAFAERVARGVAAGRFDRGILVCGTGIGMAIAANKIPGVRAATVTDVEMARLSRAHNDANVLALGGRLLDRQRALEIVRTFLETPFDGNRHQRRLDQIRELETRG